jgi:hypothetical protein
MNFKQFFIENEEEKNVNAMLEKLPNKHAILFDKFKLHYVGGNTLKGDNKHIGVIDKNKITIAAPWHYGREFTTLHELGHMVFEKICSPKWKKEWSKIVKKNPKRQKLNNEELWCMAYANHFAKNKIDVHNHFIWEKYMKKFCMATGGNVGKSPEQN